jgi:hypothetical protein
VSGRDGLARRPAVTDDQEVTMPQYLVSLTFRPGEGPQEGTPEFDAEMAVWGQINNELREAGAVLGASGLHIDTATTVRKRDGELVVTDGPYAETKETLFSFYLLEVEDLDAAIAWAAKMPAAEYGSVDIRPMVNFELR